MARKTFVNVNFVHVFESSWLIFANPKTQVRNRNDAISFSEALTPPKIKVNLLGNNG